MCNYPFCFNISKNCKNHIFSLIFYNISRYRLLTLFIYKPYLYQFITLFISIYNKYSYFPVRVFQCGFASWLRRERREFDGSATSKQKAEYDYNGLFDAKGASSAATTASTQTEQFRYSMIYSFYSLVYFGLVINLGLWIARVDRLLTKNGTIVADGYLGFCQSWTCILSYLRSKKSWNLGWKK